MSLQGVYRNGQRGRGRGSNDTGGSRLFLRKDNAKASVAARRAAVEAPAVPVPVNTPSLRSQALVHGGEYQRTIDLVRPARSRRPAGWSATDTSSSAPARGDAKFAKHFPDLGEVKLQKQKDEELARLNATKASRYSVSTPRPFITTVTSIRPQSGGGHTSAPLRPGGRVSSVRMKRNDASGAMGSSVSGGPSGTQGGDGGNRDSRRRRWGTGMSSGGIDGGLSSGGNAWRGMGADQSRKGKGGVNDSKYVGEEEWMQVEPTPGSQVRSGGDGKGSNKNSQASSHGVSGAGPELETETGKQGEPPSSPGFAAQATGALPSVPVRSTRDPYYPGKAWVGRKEEERNAVSITTQDCLKDQFEAEATSLAEAEIVQSEGGRSLEESVEHIAVEVDQHIVAAERVGRPQMVEDEEEKELPIFRESEEVVGIAGEDGRHLEKLDGGSFGNQTATVPPPTIGITEAQNSREPSWGSDLSSSLNYIQRGSGSYAAVADKYAQSGSSSYSLTSDPIIVRPTKVDWGGGAASHLLQNPVDGGTIHHRLGSSPVTFDRAVVPPLRVSSSSPTRTSPVESEYSWINLKGNPQFAAHPTAIVHSPAPGMTEESHTVFSSLDMPMSSHPWAANSHPISEGVGHLPGFRHSSSDKDLVQIFTQLGSAGNEETGSGGNGGQAPVQSSTSGVFRKGGGVNLLKSDIMHGNAVTHGHDFFSLGHSTTSPSQPPVGHFTSTLPISSSMTSLCSKNNEVGGGRPNLHVNPNYLNK